MQNIIQVAGIHDIEEANLLIKARVNYLDFPLRLPVHTPDLPEKKAAEIIRALPLHITNALII